MVLLILTLNSVYSNVSIPGNWKNKIHYNDEMLKIFSKDQRFVAYLGKGQAYKADRSKQTLNSTATLFPQIDNNNSCSLENSMDIFTEKCEGNVDKSESKPSKSPRNIRQSAKKFTTLSKKDITNILEDLRQNFPIKNVKIHDPKNKVSIPFRNNSCLSMSNVNQISREAMFRNSMYSMFQQQLAKHRSKTCLSKLKEKKIEFGPFLNFNYKEYNKKLKITNKVVKKELERINNFGPFYSHCPSCNNKNIEFYGNMDTNNCLTLLKTIKKSRGSSAI